MRWITSEIAWETRAVALEIAHQMSETGRMCHEATCSARSEIAFEVEGESHRWYAGFCLRHAVEFACEHHEVIVGLPRRLKIDEALHGPLVDDEEG